VAPLVLSFLVLERTLSDRGWAQWKGRLGALVLPLFGILALWLLVNKWFLGHWSGHYGDAVHLKFDIRAMFGTALKYMAKHLLFVRYWTGPYQAKVYGFLDKSAVVYAFLAVFTLFFFVWTAFYKKLSNTWQWAGLGLGLFFGAILPVSNLFFYTELYSENDRYGYFASAFVWWPALLLLANLPRWARWGIVVPIVGVSVYLLVRMTTIWGASERVYKGLVNDFRWFDAPQVVLLATPDNYKGVLLFRHFNHNSTFSEVLWQRRGQRPQGTLIEGVQYNLGAPTDAVRVHTDSTGLRHKISFPQDGNWFWSGGVGFTPYERPGYKVEKGEWDCTVVFDALDSARVVVYPVGDRWVEIKPD
jgi:hypothetical protein